MISFLHFLTQKVVFFRNPASRKHSKVLVLYVEHSAILREMITTMIRTEM